jgi:hypothetical protein
MKRFLSCILLSAMCVAQNPIRTLTRTVTLFGGLERKLADASSAERATYLAEDFEERRCAQPGTPVARDQWLASPPEKMAFGQQAVHSYGDLAIYSALASSGTEKDMVVDTWKKDGEAWKLAVRYRCPSSGNKLSPTLNKRY